MPDHFHLLITPQTSLERAVQFIKGGFSYRAKKELQSNLEVWQKGFSDHRIRDCGDYQKHVQYIFNNPIKRGLVSSPEEYLYSSIQRIFEKDPIPQRLKPVSYVGSNDPPEGVSLQSTASKLHIPRLARDNNSLSSQELENSKLAKRKHA
jgi:putative transposase